MNTQCNFHKDGTLPENGEVFVFGSNTLGAHGGGAAAVAFSKFGAVVGEALGLQGNSYAVATLDSDYKQLPIGLIKLQVDKLGEKIILNSVGVKTNFFITRVGCGIAGYRNRDIAPLFMWIARKSNVSLPEEWWEYVQ